MNSQWLALQLGWLDQWMERCIRSLQRSGFHSLGQTYIFQALFNRLCCSFLSGTPPYDHPVYKTTSLLRPYSFKPNVKTIESFYYFEDPVNATTSLLRPGFYGPTVVTLTGFHCTAMIILISLSYISIHVIYHELTMTCSPVGLISSMDRALSLGPNPGQDWIFSGSFFHLLILFILLRWSCSLMNSIQSANWNRAVCVT